MTFKQYIELQLGYLPRIIDLARDIGESRGELVGKWYRGTVYPDKKSCERLAKVLNITSTELQKVIYQLRIDNL